MSRKGKAKMSDTDVNLSDFADWEERRFERHLEEQRSRIDAIQNYIKKQEDSRESRATGARMFVNAGAGPDAPRWEVMKKITGVWEEGRKKTVVEEDETEEKDKAEEEDDIVDKNEADKEDLTNKEEYENDAGFDRTKRDRAKAGSTKTFKSIKGLRHKPIKISKVGTSDRNAVIVHFFDTLTTNVWSYLEYMSGTTTFDDLKNQPQWIQDLVAHWLTPESKTSTNERSSPASGSFCAEALLKCNEQLAIVGSTAFDTKYSVSWSGSQSLDYMSHNSTITPAQPLNTTLPLRSPHTPQTSRNQSWNNTGIATTFLRSTMESCSASGTDVPQLGNGFVA